MRLRRRLIASGSPFEPVIGFSRVVVDGHHVAVSGTAPIMQDGGDPPADTYGRAHGEVFADVRPASTMIVVNGFLDPRWMVEMEADAILP